MDYKKTNAPLNTVTRDLIEMSEQTGNIYETVCVVSKRANQIAVEMKKDLEKKLQEFASMSDNLEEISENRKTNTSPNLAQSNEIYLITQNFHAPHL